MRATMIAMVPCCLLLGGTVFPAEVGEERNPQGDTGRPRVFNVLR